MKMSISNISSGRKAGPVRVVLYGVEGIGKSTFGSHAPSPVFIGAEDGTDHLNVQRFPSPETWPDIIEAIRTLSTETHDFKTLVVDSLDWAEPLLWDHICKRDNKKDIESYGYGKGYKTALMEWRVFLASLDRLRRAKQMNVILIAHSWIKTFKNPLGDDYDRHEMKIDARAAPLIREWATDVLFTNYETFAVSEGNSARAKGVSTGKRLIYTQQNSAYDAKNHHDLPVSIPLSWKTYEEYVKEYFKSAKDWTDELSGKLKKLNAEDQKTASEAIARASGDVSKLAQLNQWVEARQPKEVAK